MITPDKSESYPEQVTTEQMERLDRELFARCQTYLRSRKLYHAGLYDPADESIFINADLDQFDAELVYFHELTHYQLGKLHWGEAIRRLDHIEIVMASRLQHFRGLIIFNFMCDYFGRKPTPNEIELLKDCISLRKGVRNAMLTNELFMRGIYFLGDCARRKITLAQEWTAVQEGYAYWTCIYGHQGCPFDAEHRAAIEQRSIRILRSLPDILSSEEVRAFEAVVQLAQLQTKLDLPSSDHNQRLCAIVAICVSPSFVGIPILDAHIAELQRHVSSPAKSPNKRLFRAVEILQRQHCNLDDLCALLDPKTVCPKMSNQEFCHFWWKAVDANPKFVELFNDISDQCNLPPFNLASARMTIQKNKVDDGWKEPHIEFSDEPLPSYASFVNGHLYEPLRQQSLESFWRSASFCRDSLMNMARCEGFL